MSRLRWLKIIFLVLLFVLETQAQDTTKVNFKLVEKKLPFGLTCKIPAALPKIGVALSGGGSRGFAHLGILYSLEKSHIPINLIVGTSMGSIIGGLYSAGYSIEKLKEVMFSTDWSKFTNSKEVPRRELYLEQKLTEDRSLVSFRIKGFKLIIPQSINTGQNISNFLNLLVFNAPLHSDDFLNFPIKFKAVATNLVTGNKVLLQKGSLTKAMRASSSVSFLLPPVSVDSTLLVDGGLAENLPTKSVRQSSADIVLGSNTISPLRGRKNLRFPWEIAEQIVSIPMELLTQQEKKAADIVVEPNLGLRNNMDFSKPEELFSKGFEAMQKKLPRLKKLFFEKFKQKIGNGKILKNLSLYTNPNRFEEKVFENITPHKDTTVADLLIALYKSCDFNECKDFSLKLIKGNEKTFFRLDYELNPIIKEVLLSGVDADNYSTILKKLSSLKDKNYSSLKVFNVLLDILRFYRGKGLSLANIEKVKFDNGLLSLKINEGIVNSLIIKGNKHTNTTVILRELPIEAGKPFNIKDLQEGLRNLQITNLFSEIEANLSTKGGKHSIVIKLKEKIPGALRFGFRLDNENYTQFLMDLRDENLFGNGSQAGMILTLGTRKRGIFLEHKANRIFNTYFTYKFKIYKYFQDVFDYKDEKTANEREISRVQNGEYRQVFTGVSLGLGTQTKKFGNLITEIRYEKNEIKNKLNYHGETYNLNLVALKFNLQIDSQDKYPFPRNGILVNSYYETAQKIFGSEIGYTKFLLDYKFYFSLTPFNTVETRVKFGSGDLTTPLSQQFSLGGQSSFFGMRDFEFRGRQIFLTSLGYRIKLPFKLFFDSYFKIRYDLGAVWARREAIKLNDLRHGIGATLAFDTPVGPANFSVGKSFVFKNRLENQIIKWSPFYFYFSIGISY